MHYFFIETFDIENHLPAILDNSQVRPQSIGLLEHHTILWWCYYAVVMSGETTYIVVTFTIR